MSFTSFSATLVPKFFSYRKTHSNHERTPRCCSYENLLTFNASGTNRFSFQRRMFQPIVKEDGPKKDYRKLRWN